MQVNMARLTMLALVVGASFDLAHGAQRTFVSTSGNAGGGTVVATVSRNTIAQNGSWGAIVSSLGATLNIADNVIVANGSRGLLQQTNGILNSIGNNIVRDNDAGQTLGAITPIAGI